MALSRADPLKKLSLAVHHALQSPYFRPFSTDPTAIQDEIRRTKNITALCEKCDKASDKAKIKVSIYRTSNLSSHLRKHHEPGYCAAFTQWLAAKRQAFVARHPRRVSETRVRQYSSSVQKRFDDALVKFIMNSMVPLQVVEQEPFKNMLYVLGFKHKGLKLMSRRTLGRCLEKAYADYRSQLKDHVAKADWVSTTADIWSGRKRSFLGMTIHWIDADYKRRAAPLACRRFRGTHSFDRIANLISEIHASFSLAPPKITACVTDNGSNFVKAFMEFGIDAANVEREPDEPSGSGEINTADDEDSPESGEEHEITDDSEQVSEDVARRQASIYIVLCLDRTSTKR